MVRHIHIWLCMVIYIWLDIDGFKLYIYGYNIGTYMVLYIYNFVKCFLETQDNVYILFKFMFSLLKMSKIPVLLLIEK